MNLLIDSRSDSEVTVEQHHFNIELFIPSLGRSDRGLTTVGQWFDNGGLCSDSSSDSSRSTVEQYRYNSGATAERQQSDSVVILVRQRSDSRTMMSQVDW